MQYTIRQIPKKLDQALRNKARRDGTSLNTAAVDALKTGLGMCDAGKKRDLSDLVGSLSKDDAVAIESAVAQMDAWDLKSQRRGKR